MPRGSCDDDQVKSFSPVMISEGKIADTAAAEVVAFGNQLCTVNNTYLRFVVF